MFPSRRGMIIDGESRGKIIPLRLLSQSVSLWCWVHICPHLFSVPQGLPVFSQLPHYTLVVSAPLTFPAKQLTLQKVHAPVGSHGQGHRAGTHGAWEQKWWPSGWGGGKLQETPGRHQVHWDPRSGSWLGCGIRKEGWPGCSWDQLPRR